ncbi:MAG: ABC transporter ATP-binding protein [Kiloniellales bacterium]
MPGGLDEAAGRARNAASLPITISGVTKSYGAFKALDDVSLEVASGEFLTLLGPSGSGKTTLLMVLAGFVRPDCGSLLFGDREIVLTPPHKRDVGMVFQNYALFPHMTVAGNVAYPLKLRKLPRGELEERVRRALELVQLGALGERRIDQLSGGQKQRVALARAIVFEPRILLMDEPLSALDKKLREQMQIELRHLHERLGMTTVYVTHDQREALTMSDRVAVIDHGRFIQIDRPRRLYERPRSRFVADFIGESSFLPVEVTGGEARLNGRALKTAEPPGPQRRQFLVVRPEKLDLVADEDGAGLNLLEGRVKEHVYQGESFLLYVTLSVPGGDDVEIAMRQPTRREVLARVPEAGKPIRLAIHPEDTILVPEAAA